MTSSPPLWRDRGKIRGHARAARESRLHALLAGIGIDAGGVADGPVRWVTDDPSEVEADTLFVFHPETPPGEVDEGIRRGPMATVGPPLPAAATRYLRVDDSRGALDQLCRRHFDSPDAGLRLIGITGTNGKGTTAYLLATALEASGRSVLMIGSLDGPPTTPRTATIYSLLREAANSGVTDVVAEVSSHGIAERRFGSCAFDLVVLTNLGTDHTDDHGGVAAYHEVKRSLLRQESTLAVVLPRELRADTPVRGDLDIIYSSLDELRDPQWSPGGTEFDWSGVSIRLPLPGRHNLENAASALAALEQLGVDGSAAARAWSRLPPLAGRFETVATQNGTKWIVDFAHNADALQAVLETAKPDAGQLIVVVGSDPNAEPSRRQALGRIAGELADLTIATEEIPASIGRQGVAGEIAAGIEPGIEVMVQPDRRDALRIAARRARPGDVVVVAGRGERAGPSNDSGEGYPTDQRLIAEVLRGEWV